MHMLVTVREHADREIEELWGAYIANPEIFIIHRKNNTSAWQLLSLNHATK